MKSPRERMAALATSEFERILRESAKDVAGQIHELDDELIRAADLCAAVREFLGEENALLSALLPLPPPNRFLLEDDE